MSENNEKRSLWQALRSLRGNQRACVYTEPLWGIPYNLYSPYATLFMVALGVNDQQIGFLLSLGAVFQVIAALLEELGGAAETIMVGDTAFDVLGAKAHNMPTVGVTWGYGHREDMVDAGAWLVVDSPEELLGVL